MDVFHLHVIEKPGVFISSLGMPLFIAGWWIIYEALMANAYAAPVVKYQKERHQVVIDRGVYSIVRHPMYAGVLPMLVGMSLFLESYFAAILAIAPMTALGVRIVFEERFLKRELTGYSDYTRHVRYRLVPYVW